MITIFTPSFADEADTNAQNLSVKEIVARLDSNEFFVVMLHEGDVDARIAARPNTKLISWLKHGNTVRVILKILSSVPDLYFFPREGPLDAAFLTLRRRLRLKTALVSYVVSGGLATGPYSPARMRHITEADSVFANNEYLGELLREKTGIAPAGIQHDGIDRRYYFAPEKRSANRPTTVLYAGSLRPYKKAPMVVRQAARWPDVRFRIAGTGEEDQLCRNLAAELRCRNVDFLGHLSQGQLAEEMRSVDIFFFPSVLEGHPQVLLQAAGTGLPIVAMNTYRPDCVVDGITGFLAETEDELSDALDKLIRDPGLRLKMGDAAVAHAARFDWDVITKNWADAFKKVVAQRRKSGGER
jgi:glycosyltransferase involved in cell wall biosynthesis